MARKLIRGHAVMNMELNEPCVEIGPDDFKSASAIYFCDYEGGSLALAKAYMKRNKFDRRKFPMLKIVEVTLSYKTT